MADTGRPRIVVRLDEHDLRTFQAVAHNTGTDAAKLARALILNHIREQNEPAAAIPDWRHGHLVLRDDNGALLNAHDFGLAPGEKIRASYVRAHPELPWPRWIIATLPERTDRGHPMRNIPAPTTQEWTP